MYKIKFIYNSKLLLYVFIVVLFLVDYTGTCQNTPKKMYTSELDSLWSINTFPRDISPNGNWLIYSEVYVNKENLLTLRSTLSSLGYTIKNCNIVAFSNNNKWFGGISGDHELILVDLQNHTKDVYPDIAPRLFNFSNSGKYVAAYQKEDDSSNALLIINLENKTVTTISGVTTYKWHPVNEQLLLVKKLGSNKTILHYNAEDGESIYLTENRNSDYQYLNWSDFGSAVFIEKHRNNILLHHMDSNGKLKVLDEKAIAALGIGYHISGREAYISKDGKRVFFYRQLINKKQEGINPQVEIWDSDDPWIYSRMQYYKEMELQYLLTAWYPETGELVAIETEKTPTSAIDINHEYALVYNQLDYEPQYKYFPNSDLYIKNMKTGKTRLVTKNQYTEAKFVTISPKGKYISYFKNNNWWVYDIVKDNAVNVTEGVPGVFENRELELAGDLYPYGNPGWLGNDEYIIIYDRYDIWRITPDGSEKRRITKGREENMQYIISRDISRNDFFKITINQNFVSTPFNLKNGILLEVFNNDDYKSGYALWQKDNSVEILVLEDLKMNSVLGAKDLSTLIYSKQKFNQPIGIYSLNLKTKEEKLLYQSNQELMDYDLGKAELIKYTTPTGKSLKGSLVYPANFNPVNIYPMIVHIYERESKKILNFHPPSDYMMDGFNLLKYTTNGYFVFFPDFTYTIGDPGISALKSLTVAVNKVLEKGSIDIERIGLIGHSFGGYETAFIITQTDMFAGAVAGAAVTNAVSYYHNVFWDMKMNQMWRMENQQWRLGASFYNDKEAYYRNSPLHHIENVNTPLLLWTGKLDTNVNWDQSVSMFMGLKRLNKKTRMLLFDKEPHAIMQNESQQTLSQEIFDWMETYVKKNKG